jgi:hypothetical protein
MESCFNSLYFFLLQRALLSTKSCRVPHRGLEKDILKVPYVLSIVDSDCCDQTCGAKIAKSAKWTLAQLELGNAVTGGEIPANAFGWS